VID
jgi:hypothetical protein